MGNRDRIGSKGKKPKGVTKNYQVIEKGGMASLGLGKSKLVRNRSYEKAKQK